ncbi:DNA polymerase III subunit chi [Kordiimonas sediminis]|uniref:DNA polymerase III subunit chi n=1 Tax=Kordiimonas sediminis TaxID=1735581 RepID=A0A919AV25_9PROT|nr:DNA polymerase III subunit chi [Kordiimonas sediminis]GHF27664.1 DNA polymerase III subunit chi [Kordiimonas sediminis]
MADIRFYHLQKQPLEEALPRLLERVQGAGLRALIKCPDQETMDNLNTILWTYDAASFLPHDTANCAHPTEQQFLLTLEDGNDNNAEVLVLINAVGSEHIPKYQRCLYMFDGRNDSIVDKARSHWKSYKELQIDMSYWQQREQGGWEQKA